MAFDMQSGNPALGPKVFERNMQYSSGETMTETGTLNKFSLLLVLMVAAASYTWKLASEGQSVMWWIVGGLLTGLVCVIAISVKPVWSPYIAPVYAAAQGLFLGAISAYYNAAFAQKAPGLILQTVCLTFGTVIAMFALYRFRIIEVTQKFKSIVLIATAGIGVFYLITIVLRLFHIQMPLLHDSNWLGIGLSLFIVAIAALNLVLDFDRIDQGVAMGAPKFMEWYGAFGLLVTIVWLYLEILRLLSKFSNRK